MDVISLPNQTNGVRRDLDVNGQDFPYSNAKADIDVDTFNLKALESELPTVENDQKPVAELLSRVVQAIYAELTEFAETYVLYN